MKHDWKNTCEDCGKPAKHALCPSCLKKFRKALKANRAKRMITKGGF